MNDSCTFINDALLLPSIAKTLGTQHWQLWQSDIYLHLWMKFWKLEIIDKVCFYWTAPDMLLQNKAVSQRRPLVSNLVIYSINTTRMCPHRLALMKLKLLKEQMKFTKSKSYIMFHQLRIIRDFWQLTGYWYHNWAT